MKITAALRDAFVIAGIFIGFQTLQATLLKDALAEMDHLAARRLLAAVTGVLTKAHKAKDDIAIVQILDSLNQAPGVIQAQLLNPESKSLLGPKTYSSPLKEGTRKWGILALSLSDHLRGKFMRRQWLFGTGSAASVCIMIFLYMQFLARRNTLLHTQTEELRQMLQASQHQWKIFAEREQSNATKAAICLQETLERVGGPVVVLDWQQRVAAINADALGHLGFLRAEEALTKSWHEVPLLQSCGTLLEESLQSPLAEMRLEVPVDGRVVSLKTLKGGSGTWVALYPSKRIVE